MNHPSASAVRIFGACAVLAAGSMAGLLVGRVGSATAHTTGKFYARGQNSRSLNRNHSATLAGRVQQSGAPVLRSAPAADLRQYFGITLSTPAAQPVIDAARAEHLALGGAYGTGDSVSEDVLATIHNANVPSQDGCFCWVVARTRPGGNAYTSGEIMKLQFDLVFIDGRTGAFVGEIQRGPVTPQPRGKPAP
jgi:hypothetical protein